jgi:hypothetical protein
VPWLLRRSPLTNLKLAHKHLVPNRAIKSAVQSILQRGGGSGEDVVVAAEQQLTP